MKKGIALILMVFLIVACSLVALMASSLLVRGTQSSLALSQSTQALAIAIGGKEWCLEQLEVLSDWGLATDQSDIALGSGTFDVDVDESTRTTKSVSFKVTGKISGYSGQTVQKEISVTAERMPSACRFAVYKGSTTVSSQDISSTTINGDFWSNGNATIQSGSTVAGICYHPDTSSIIGLGTYTAKAIGTPYPTMPQIDETYYNNLISTANSYISTYGTSSDITVSTSVNLTGGFYGYRNITTTGNITISGNGFVIASRNINLHSTNGASGTLTISPSGGNIYFLAGRNLTVNSTQNDTNVIINGDANNKVYLYSQDSANSRLVRIRKHSSTTTTVDSAVIIGERRIIVEDGAQITNSTLYVSDVSDDNNYLQITDSGTAVGTSGNPCSVISVSGRNPGLIINDNASVLGFVYHWGDDTGYTQIDNATVAGSVIANQYYSDDISDSTITYSATALPVVPPEGFNTASSRHITTRPNSWDDN